MPLIKVLRPPYYLPLTQCRLPTEHQTGRKSRRTQAVAYHYDSPDAAHTQEYLMPEITKFLHRHCKSNRIFEIGCGNGANAAYLYKLGYEMVGIDPSPEGIAVAARAYPHLDVQIGSTDEDLSRRFGTFDTLLSLEVVEHVFSAKSFAQQVRGLLNPGGIALISTPYHGYAKNVALAFTGKLDSHFTALWEGGHIKFWSRKTLGSLFEGVGMREIEFSRVGRIPPLAKSMICVYQRPN